MTLPLSAVTTPPSLTITMSMRAAVEGAPVDNLTFTLSPTARAAIVTCLLPSKNVVVGMIASVAETVLDCWTVSDVELSAVTMPVKVVGTPMATLMASRAVWSALTLPVATIFIPTRTLLSVAALPASV